MRLMISGGGTGGHVYPALAVVHAFKENIDKLLLRNEDLEILWIGSESGMEKELVMREEIDYKAISAAPLRGKQPQLWFWSLLRQVEGYRQSQKLIAIFQPESLLITGGYVCVPIALAARRANVPILIYLPDIKPGFAIQFLARFARKVAVTANESQRYFKKSKTLVTGYPARPELFSHPRLQARQRFTLIHDLPVMLVFGGSRGAHSINLALAKHLTSLLPYMQILHISGHQDAKMMMEVMGTLPKDLRIRYRLHEYLHEQMADALASADLILSRAGAAVIGEYPAVGVPSLLVPYPFAGKHQWFNASYLARNGAAIIIENEALSQKLPSIAIDLINDYEQRRQMAAAASRLARPDAALQIAKALVEMRP